jgi:hypothetical protein
MSLPHSHNKNHLLAALPTAEFGRVAPHLELFPMRLDPQAVADMTAEQRAQFKAALAAIDATHPSVKTTETRLALLTWP